ncbi:MAG: membrane protein insertase YidC [Kiritimatiellae bacterium]|nr:membrane protein insertase YidC [Kiritimatiellia bacterium]
MNKTDKVLVAILAVLICCWFALSRRDAQRMAEWRAAHPEVAAAGADAQFEAISNPEDAAIVSAAGDPTADPASGNGAGALTEAIPGAAAAVRALAPERVVCVSNSVLDLVFTSHGGAVKSATMRDYNLSLDPEDGPVAFDFGDFPALAIEGIPGLGRDADFALSEPEPGIIRAECTAGNGMRLVRTITATNGYHLAVRDEFSGLPADALPETSLALGPITAAGAAGGSAFRASVPTEGVDVRTRDAAGKAKTLEQNASSALAKGATRSFAQMFGAAAGGGCSAPRIAPNAPLSAEDEFAPAGQAIDFVAVRERFFVEVLTPSLPASSVRTILRRKSGTDGALQLESLASRIGFRGESAGADGTVTRSYSLYLGPRKMDELLSEDSITGVHGHFDIMRFGTWSWFCKWLLTLLNAIHRVVPNYGWAIIVLTAIVRLILFPINRKSAQGMRKMSELQPKMKEINERYKDDPQKRQAETMRLYQENHVNPLSSCLPMLIQLPIFIALFTVLRSAVELRYAPFLWISDLSEPENCFRDTLGFGVNFLPIAMAATMTLQSRLTPSAGDPQQQKMMTVMMPIMMLVMCYSFASALGLYWSVSQALAIFGMWYARRGTGAKTAASK